jgi:heptaprenyl diphosphate synthase
MIDNAALPIEATDPLADAIGKVTANLNGILRLSPPIIRRLTSHLAGSQGKQLRARSLLTCSRDPQGLISDNAVTVATAVELVHLATLVHDDVIDQADTRRGRPTLRKEFGNKAAVICGDYLLTQGVRLLAALQDPEHFLHLRFQDYLSVVCLGELNQFLNNNNFNLTPLQYFRIINGKTAALFEASFLAGAVVGGEPQSLWPLYRRLGHCVGMIFQLNDDCLDFESDVQSAGKNVHSDYEQNVVTLPLIYALSADPDFKDQVLAAHQQGEKLQRAEVNKRVNLTRGLDRTHQIVDRYGAKARAILAQLPISAQKHHELSLLLSKALRH